METVMISDTGITAVIYMVSSPINRIHMIYRMSTLLHGRIFFFRFDSVLSISIEIYLKVRFNLQFWQISKYIITF